MHHEIVPSWDEDVVILEIAARVRVAGFQSGVHSRSSPGRRRRREMRRRGRLRRRKKREGEEEEGKYS